MPCLGLRATPVTRIGREPLPSDGASPWISQINAWPVKAEECF
jgi:hypothetical protein